MHLITKNLAGYVNVPEEIAEGCNVSIFAMYYGIETVGDSSLMIFPREKFMKFHGADKLFRDDSTIVEVAVHTLSSNYLTNMPQAIILRNFVVRYLNDLVSKALN